MAYNNSSDSATRSETSETLSEFVRRRYDGEVAVFGGNPMVGARQAVAAVRTSTESATTALVDALQHFAASVRASPTSAQATPRLQQRTGAGDFTTQDVVAASSLDPEKVQRLLSASMISALDVKAFAVLIAEVQLYMKRKVADVGLRRARQIASRSSEHYFLDYEIEDLVDSSCVQKLRGYLVNHAVLDEVTDAVFADLQRAVLHDSMTSGRNTNRTLAMLGDAMLRATVIRAGYSAGQRVRDISDVATADLTNRRLAEVMRDGSVLRSCVIVAEGVDPVSSSVGGTFMEAIYGVVGLYGGLKAVFRLNTTAEFRVSELFGVSEEQFVGTVVDIGSGRAVSEQGKIEGLAVVVPTPLEE